MALMTPEKLRELCRKDSLYQTASLNDKLYLHYKGFREIANLGPYTGLRVLWLEGNGLTAIQGLEAQVEMRTLYLQENCIERIEGLEHMVRQGLAVVGVWRGCEGASGVGSMPRSHQTARLRRGWRIACATWRRACGRRRDVFSVPSDCCLAAVASRRWPRSGGLAAVASQRWPCGGCPWMETPC